MKKFFILCSLLCLAGLSANPVIPGRRYRVDFEARTIHPAYPLDWFCQGVKLDKAEYPGISFRFVNAKKKEVKPAAKRPFYQIFSDKFTPESFEFYAPDGAVKLVLHKSGVIVRNLKVTEIPIGKNLALPTNYHVVGPARNAVISINPDNTVVFDVSANGVVETMSVPVESGKRYRLTVYGGRGFRSGKHSSLLVRYYFRKTANGKPISANKEALRIANPEKPLVYEILAPKNARWFSLWCMWGKFHSYKLEAL